MTLNYKKMVEKYPKPNGVVAVPFLAVESSLYLVEN